MHEDGKYTEIGAVWDVDDSGRDVMGVVSSDPSGVLNFILFMCIEGILLLH